MADPARMSINQATTREQYSLAEAILAYAQAGVTGISIWRDKLAECGLKEAAWMLDDHGLRVSGLCRAGQFPGITNKERQARIDDNLLAVDQAVTLGADCIIVVAGGYLSRLVGSRFRGADQEGEGPHASISCF